MRDRIVFVRMTLRAACRQPHPDRTGRRNAVDHRIEAKLQRVDTTFFVQHRVSMETGRDTLIDCRIRQHVARELLDRELVERHIFV